jgi:hypothetical protein
MNYQMKTRDQQRSEVANKMLYDLQISDVGDSRCEQ